MSLHPWPVSCGSMAAQLLGWRGGLRSRAISTLECAWLMLGIPAGFGVVVRQYHLLILCCCLSILQGGRMMWFLNCEWTRCYYYYSFLRFSFRKWHYALRAKSSCQHPTRVLSRPVTGQMGSEGGRRNTASLRCGEARWWLPQHMLEPICISAMDG